MSDRAWSLIGCTLVLYDGECGLCDGFVRFLFKRDQKGDFRYAALQSETARSALLKHGLNSQAMNTVCVLPDYGLSGERVLTKSAAVLVAAEKLGGMWRLASIFRIVPCAWRDALYDLVARHRYRIFGRRTLCELPAAAHRERFLS